ncbi:hypothetical protein AB0I10_36795 [Streptomyces sp. NPDC050636]|uniref:hypothetical protein n=1 Tax=Streptomyces sp. NPDC050636 TaxID=3154510 RepID=UPI00343F8CB7
MFKSLLAHHRHQRFSDAEIGQLVRRGRVAAFQTVVVRHWPAAVAYLDTCFTDRAVVSRIAEQVFSDLYDATVESTPPGGPWRVHVLTSARTLALREWTRAPEAGLTDGFRSWAEAGGPWPLTMRSGLTDAYRCLLGRQQTLLWHAVVELEPAAVMARALGMEKREVGAFADLSRDTLRETYRALPTRNAPSAGHAEHALSVETRLDLNDLDGQLRAQLPVMLLGWWEGSQYAQVRAVTKPPSAFLPFLVRAASSAARTPRRHSLIRHSAGLFLGLFAGGMAAAGAATALDTLNASYDKPKHTRLDGTPRRTGKAAGPYGRRSGEDHARRSPAPTASATPDARRAAPSDDAPDRCHVRRQRSGPRGVEQQMGRRQHDPRHGRRQPAAIRQHRSR